MRQVYISVGVSRRSLLAAPFLLARRNDYFPPSDERGGWRTLESPAEIRRVAGLDRERLDEAFAYLQRNTKHGGLVVARRGWLVYERYFGRGHREATPNGASVGKSFTSIAAGILLQERRDAFPDGLDQRVWTTRYLPAAAFPLDDPARAEIRLGHLLAMTSGIRGNNPGYVRGKPVQIDPPGPDGWPATVDENALRTPLWCRPGEGYSYATAGIHIVSIVLRQVAGRELKQYIEEHLARPMGWGRWGWGYRRPEIRHTPGGGGIALRARDMLRFAYLLLREGRWGERQLVPADYVRQCGRRSRYNPHYPYSLQFNVNAEGTARAPREAFWKMGSGGHCLYVVPSLDLVVYKLGGRDEQYSRANTGLEPPPYDGSRDGWKPDPEAADYGARPLELIVRAVV